MLPRFTNTRLVYSSIEALIAELEERSVTPP